MEELYRKMYAHLVGGVDDALQMLAGMVTGGTCDREAVIQLGEKLKNALLEAEDMYIEAEEEDGDGRGEQQEGV